MTSQINRDSLREGACYALEHCARLAEDAAILYAAKRVPSSFHLAVMAREELGRFNILWKRAGEMGDSDTIDAQEMADHLKPHKLKLRAGQSIVHVPMTEEMDAKWIAAIKSKDTTTAAAIAEDLRRRANIIRERAPSDIHNHRLKTQYVDLNPKDGSWSKPGDVDAPVAHTLILTVMAEIANALIAAQGDSSIGHICQAKGQLIPDTGTFTRKVLGHLFNADA
jgi:AbiV family abortive infection protein